MNKMPALYKVARIILSPIFMWYYKPTIIGEENLNIDGPMIIASNHIHLYDQCFMIVKRKKVITYMAKKEYFDSKKTKWFFKGVGCIPVDRTKKDLDAVESALEVLNSGGVIGIFPEGTRNALKVERCEDIYKECFKNLPHDAFIKELMDSKQKLSQIHYLMDLYKNKTIKKKELQDNIFRVDDYLLELVKDKVIKKDDYYNSLLLDFKFGAVSMAKKTNAKIIPVGIAGNYKFHSKDLCVRIGSPIDISDMDLEKANKLLRKTIKELIKESKEG